MKIGILGLGLIGGSLGFDFRTVGHYVIGVSRQQETCERAIALGAVDEAGASLERLNAIDVVFICTPLGVMQKTTQTLIPYLSQHTILTDVGSVKASVVETLEPLWARFVGGHPMAGKEVAGIGSAQPFLFQNRPYVLTPTPQTCPEAQAVLMGLIGELQSQYYQCSPSEHDRAVAWISHLPVMVSSSLIAACLQEPDAGQLALAQSLASSGFRDTSRVGGGNSELGRMMAQYNSQEILRSLQFYRASLDRIEGLIQQQEWDELEALLGTTHQARPKFVE